MFLLRFNLASRTGSAQHRRSHDDAHPENDRRRNDGRGDVAVLKNFAVEVAGRAFVKQLVSGNRGHDADGRKEQLVANGLTERLGMPRWRGRNGILRRL